MQAHRALQHDGGADQLGAVRADVVGDVGRGVHRQGSVTRTYSGGAAQVGAAPGPPPAAGSEVGERSRLLHLATVIGPDVGIVAVLAVAVSVTLASTGVLTDAIGVALVASVTLLVYVVGTRLAFASTAGEPRSGTSYSQVLPALE